MSPETENFILTLLEEIAGYRDEMAWREYRKAKSDEMISRTDLVEISTWGDPHVAVEARVRLLAKTALYKSRDPERVAKRAIYAGNENFGRF